MKAAVVRAFKQPLVIEDRALPEPGEGQVLVKIEDLGSVPHGHARGQR